MNISSAKAKLLDKSIEIGHDQFEYLSKILIEEVENPRNIELTPFGGDGGIDIRGSYGRSFFDARFGVEVKQHQDNIGTPAMRDFIGAFSQHDFQFGCYISWSDFSSGAVELAQREPIILVNGDQLTDVMVAHEIGVTYDGFDYELDPDFWEIFQRTEADELVLSGEVPQANSIDILHLCLEAVENGLLYKPQIAEYMAEHTDKDDWSKRQGDYYPKSGWMLGYIHKDTKGEYDGEERRQWGLTRDGTEYLELLRQGQTEEAEEDLRQHIRDSAIMQRVLPFIKENGEVSRSELVDFVAENTELSRKTSYRRMSSIGVWLDKLPEIQRRPDGHSIEFVYIPSNLNDYVDDS